MDNVLYYSKRPYYYVYNAYRYYYGARQRVAMFAMDQSGEIYWIVWLSKMEEDPPNIHKGLQLRWAEKGVETARITVIYGNKNMR